MKANKTFLSAFIGVRLRLNYSGNFAAIRCSGPNG